MDEKGNSVYRNFTEMKLSVPNLDENNNLASENFDNKTPRSLLEDNEKLNIPDYSETGSGPAGNSSETPVSTATGTLESSSKPKDQTQFNSNEITKQPSTTSMSSFPSCIFVNTESSETCAPEEDESEISTSEEHNLINGILIRFSFYFYDCVFLVKLIQHCR